MGFDSPHLQIIVLQLSGNGKYQTERSHSMGDKGGKKDKNKSDKQKKSKDQQKAKKKQDTQQKKTP